MAQDVLGLPTDTPNRTCGTTRRTVPAVAAVMAKDLTELQPDHAAYFQGNLTTFNASWCRCTTPSPPSRPNFPGTPAAATEPVADYLLPAMGIDNLTPFRFQADIMNGVDPNPQDVTLENGFFTQHQVKFFAYNQQVVDDLTTSIRQTAIEAGVRVVGVYEMSPPRATTSRPG